MPPVTLVWVVGMRSVTALKGAACNTCRTHRLAGGHTGDLLATFSSMVVVPWSGLEGPSGVVVLVNVLVVVAHVSLPLNRRWGAAGGDARLKQQVSDVSS